MSRVYGWCPVRTLPGRRSLVLLLAVMVALGTVRLDDRSVLAQAPPLQPLKPSPALAEAPPGRWEVFAGGRDAPGELVSASGVATDAAGTIYVGDPGNVRVQKFTADGRPAGSFPIWPGWVGRVSQIRDIAVAPGGDVLVLFENPMPFDGPEPYFGVRYAASGKPLGQFGPRGPAPHGLDRPSALDVSPNGTVWVADTAHHRLVAYGWDGTPLREIGSQGNERGQFQFPEGVGVGPNGALYVADTGNNRVQILSAVGTPLAVWDDVGEEPGQFRGPRRVRVGSDGSVFVTETDRQYTGSARGNRRIQRIAPDGVLVAGAWIYEAGPFTVAPDGSVLVMGSYSSDGIRRFNTKLEEFDPLVSVKVPPETPGRLLAPHAVAIDPQDNVYVVDSKQVAVYVYAPNGTLLTRWGTTGDAFGQLRDPSAIQIASDGTIYLADYALDRVYKLSSDWRLLDVWGGAGDGPGRLSFPHGLALDAQGNLYVADSRNGQVQKFGPGGEVLAVWRGSDDRSGLGAGDGVAVDARGRVYTHGSSPTVMRLMPDGTLDRPFAAFDRAQLHGLTIAPDGNVWVVDYQGGKVWKLDQEGEAIAVWGSVTLPQPSFSHPTGVAIDRSGRVYVTEEGQARVWRFTPEAAR